MSADRHSRGILPIPDRPGPGLTTFDTKDPDSVYPPIEPLRPPHGAPNVLVVLLDDVGFGASSAFGGPCRTPTAERLAAGGLRYNRFHNVLGIHEFVTEAEAPLPAGNHQLRAEFGYDGGGLAKGGNVTLFYDGDDGPTVT